MTIQTYLENRLAKVEKEFAGVGRDLSECIQPADWVEFSAAATKRLEQAYRAFCSSIYWGIVRGGYGGLRSFRMASTSETYFRHSGRLGLLAVSPVKQIRLGASPSFVPRKPL